MRGALTMSWGESAEATVCFTPWLSGLFSLPIYVDYGLYRKELLPHWFPSVLTFPTWMIPISLALLGKDRFKFHGKQAR